MLCAMDCDAMWSAAMIRRHAGRLILAFVETCSVGEQEAHEAQELGISPVLGENKLFWVQVHGEPA